MMIALADLPERTSLLEGRRRSRRASAVPRLRCAVATGTPRALLWTPPWPRTVAAALRAYRARGGRAARAAARPGRRRERRRRPPLAGGLDGRGSGRTGRDRRRGATPSPDPGRSGARRLQLRAAGRTAAAAGDGRRGRAARGARRAGHP